MKKKNSYYFQHDVDARNDPKLIDLMRVHGVGGIGVFWCIVEQLYQEDGRLPMERCKSIAFALHVDCTMVTSVVNDFGLFKSDGAFFWSESALNRINRIKDISQARKKAATTRWTPPVEDPKPEEPQQPTPPPTPTEPKEPKEPVKRFNPPTVEEVKTYIQEKGYTVDAEAFVAFYESKNWYVGKNKMKSWEAALVTWEKRNKEQRPTPPQQRRSTTVTPNINDEWK